MNNKSMLLALAAVSAAMLALPAVAPAEVAHVSSVGKFTMTSEFGTLSVLTEHESGNKVICTSATGSGEFTTTTTGKLTISFHGCSENLFGTSCTGEAPGGQPSGTITTTALEFHLIEIENNTAGVLITPNNGHFATITCGGGLVTKTVGGNGIVGHIATPCGESKVEHTISFATVNPSTPGHTQKWTQVTTTGTKYDLNVVQHGETDTASQDGSGVVHFSDGMARNIICT